MKTCGAAAAGRANSRINGDRGCRAGGIMMLEDDNPGGHSGMEDISSRVEYPGNGTRLLRTILILFLIAVCGLIAVSLYLLWRNSDPQETLILVSRNLVPCVLRA